MEEIAKLKHSAARKAELEGEIKQLYTDLNDLEETETDRIQFIRNKLNGKIRCLEIVQQEETQIRNSLMKQEERREVPV